MYLDTKKMLKWLKPWPIDIRVRGVWKVSLVRLKHFKKYKYFNKLSNGKRLTIGQVLKNLQNYKAHYLGGHKHYIEALARQNPRITAIICARNLIIDGNHSLLAMLWNGRNDWVLKVSLYEEL